VPASALTVRAIGADQHARWLRSRPSVSFLQLPSWANVKVGWRAESVGWFDGDRQVGAALILHRPVPKVRRRSLAYIPEGPVLDWTGASDRSVQQWLAPLLEHCKALGAFQVKMGPPVASRRWDAETVKKALADAEAGGWNAPASLNRVAADWHSTPASVVTDALRAGGWQQEASAGAGFGDVQPRYVYCIPLEDRSLDDVFAGFNQQWRRNIRKAEKSGVQVRLGTREDLADFHRVYVETAERDRFTPRGQVYFERMWDALNGADDDYHELTLHLAEYDGHLAAATIMIRVGDRAWYSYGASTTADRDVRPSNALQWHMITRAHEAGCRVYDLRGISATLDPANHLIGLVRFKVGSGGYAQEYVGEWDYALRPVWARAFAAYQKRTG
jgi:lipid II:glycine glycyltransferase (peptidoglycan interpeptide bridge formation enzyme)